MARKSAELEPEKREEIDKEINEIEQAIETEKKSNKVDKSLEKVTLTIPISADNEDDWICIINGHSYQIQRGVPVIVPRYVKEIYDNEQKQLLESKRRSDALIKAAQDKSSQLAFN